MPQLRLLCFGDNHGDVESLNQVATETEGETFDYIVHVGDITNACIDGMSEGAEQLQEVKSVLEDFADRSELLYVWGNRDYRTGTKPLGDRIDKYADISSMPGTHIPQQGSVTVDGQRFCQDPASVTDDAILVTHYYDSRLLEHFSGKAYFSGHTHTGRFKENVLNTAFLYRGDEHGGKPLQGGYFTVELSDSTLEVTMHSLGGLQRGVCQSHHALGTQYVPGNWRNPCQFCYDQDQFYQEILYNAEAEIRQSGRDVTEASLIETALDLYRDTTAPADFSEQLPEHAKEFI
jgi:predicted phosphodiesterase